MSAALAAAVMLMTAGADAEAATPPKSFTICGVCHATAEGAPNKVGPDLFDIIGRKAGSVEGFNYSNAMKSSGLTWTPEELDSYLESPQKVVPGTIMAFPGLRNPAQRQEIIDYLKTLK